MVKLTEREWNSMKRPIFPQIQFVSNADSFQIQTMIDLSESTVTGKIKYYIPHIMLRNKISNIKELEDFILDFKVASAKISDNYIIDEENDDKLYKIEEDGEE